MRRALSVCLVIMVSAGLHGIAAGTPAESREAAMLAVRIGEFGPPDVLQLETVPRPSAGPGELLVRVHAAAVNPIDTQVRAGHAQSLVNVRLPHVPGYDLSGEVVEAGEGVTRFTPGDPVFAMLDLRRGGAYAEYAIVKEQEAAPKPERASHVEAASLPLVALTAWQALFETADLQPGQTVLIHAGAGGVGSVAIQLARWRGAHVIATASERNHAFLRSLGADIVIDYTTQRFEEVARDVDVVLDPIGGDTQRRSLATLRDGGILVGLVGLSPHAVAPERALRTTAILVRPDASQLAEIAALVDAGQLRPVVSHRLPIAQAADAHRQSETGHTRGKIVLDVHGAAVRQTALDYIEGWYDGDAERMARSLHPRLVKRIVEHRATLGEMSAADLVAATRQGGGAGTPSDRRRADVHVLSVFGNAASVRVDAGEWVDFMHLARWDGEWKIINVLWEMR
jgi:NADPH:quinone reductase-like Zn-dependent oxidoreductase